MRRKDFSGKLFPSVELIVLMCLSVSSSSSSSSSSPPHTSLHRLNSYFGLTTLVSLIIVPWTVSGGEIQIVDTVPLEGSSGRSLSVSGRASNGENELLANIDFLTQLTNSKQGKDSEMDPLKCFPKALCGLSAESAAITRRRKTGLITDYIRLMKAVSLNPSVMEKTMKKLQKKAQEPEVQDDIENSDESDEDEDEEDEDEEEDDDARNGMAKRTGPSGYGYGSARVKPAKSKKKKVITPRPKSTSATTSRLPSRISSPKPSMAPTREGKKKRRTKKESIPENSDEFTKQFLHERAHVERLMEDGFYNEETDAQNWWNYENEKEPSLEELLDDSGGKSNSVESQYTFGGRRRPDRPYAPHRPDAPDQPQSPNMPYGLQPQSPPPKPQAPQTPSVRVPPSNGNGGSVSAIGSFFRGLFGFNNGQSQQDFSRDPFFQGFQRSMADGTPTLVTVDKTKEILTTAIEIGESLRSPSQCNTLFNGCKYQYVELLHVIDEIRQNLADKGKIDFQTDDFISKEDDEWSSTTASKIGRRKENKDKSYGYEANLSATSQAETLSPDYTAANSKVVKKSRRKSSSKRRKSSSSRESPDSTLEIASDEPTMYGSLGHHISEPPYGMKDGRKDKHQGQSSQYHYDQTSPQLQHHNYHNSYYSEYLHDKQPKGWWGTIMSWFGWRK